MPSTRSINQLSKGIITSTGRAITADLRYFGKKYIKRNNSNVVKRCHNMKKIFLSLLLCVLVTSLVFVQGQGVQESKKDAAEDTSKPAIQGDQSIKEKDNGGKVIQVQKNSRVKTGTLSTADGKEIQIQAQKNYAIQLKSGSVAAKTKMEMTQEESQDGTKLHVKLSNGRNAEVKVMPDTASEKALESLRLKTCTSQNGCDIELMEVGKGEQTKAAYEVQASKQAKFLGLFKTDMKVKAQVDAENGEVIRTKKPWWAFLAKESE